MKNRLYDKICASVSAITEGETDTVANMANIAAILGLELENINWAGFYIMRGGELVLGPFWGKPACVRIKVGRGVCGTAVMKNEIQLVSDVHEFPGHIACDAASRSEIVVPLRCDGRVVGVLDIDSPAVGRFDEEDKAGLERVAGITETACRWENK